MPRGTGANTNRLDPYKNFKFRVQPRMRRPTRNEIGLPEEGLILVDQIVEQVRRRDLLDGLPAEGVTALFAGSNGTGGITAAEVIADSLSLDLYRVDLSKVVSRYIGETEKHIRRVFDAAEQAGAVLFFDEADALFRKRSGVSDSHDRYSNLEVGYLLERMENHNGLVILATNRKNAFDPAFMRRIRFVIDFPRNGSD